MSNTIKREILVPQPREQVWRAITDSATLAEWMFPNDIEPRVGHRFTFRVPGNPKVNFDGLTVSCEVLECEPPSGTAGGRLAFSWSAGALVDTRVSFRLEPEGRGTRVYFEHTGFNLTQEFGMQAFKGAEYGWAKMLGQLPAVVAALATGRK
ncbi:SRPBCC domain-containing protein [soil metagenome]